MKLHMSTRYLPGSHYRGTYLRYDTALILKRFFWIERLIVIGEAGWITGIPDFQAKVQLPVMLWQDSLTANALRERVFELRFPSRILEIGDDEALTNLIRQSHAAPTGYAFLAVLARVLKPALRDAYEQYLQLADEIGDGPTYRFLRLAVREKQEHIALLEQLMTRCTPPGEDMRASNEWLNAFIEKFAEVGGISLDRPRPVSLDPGERFHPFEVPQRGDQFHNVRFYWPDIVDSSFPYGEGIRLQLRSAISHFNEIWAVENAGFMIYAFADQLDWEFTLDAARWIYDESRHCRMGYERLTSWGFEDSELPLGTYIYDSCKGQDPLFRLGMLFHFESKNIGKKIERIKSFSRMNDRVSQHDMDFDWADETIHTGYGTKWIAKVLEHRHKQADTNNLFEVKKYCEGLVEQTVRTATEAEISEIKSVVRRMLNKVSAII